MTLAEFTKLTSTTLSEKGYAIAKSELTPNQVEKIKQDTTVKPKVVPGYGPDEVEPFTLFNETETHIYVPRYYGYRKIGKPKHVAMPEGRRIQINFAGSMREYQRTILNAWDKHAQKHGGGIISVGPGRGKTVMAISKIAELGLKTLILVFNSDLLAQWEERIQEYTPDARIGRIRGKEISVLDKDIVIGMVQSLSNPAKDDEYPPELFAEFGMVVIDECHHIGARMFSRCLRKCAFKYTMGLSATPDRQDGLTKVFKYYLGDICYKDDAIQKTPEERLLDHIPDAKVIVHRYMSSSMSYCKEVLNYQRKPNTVIMESNIANYTPRMEYILGLLPALIAEGRKIIILTSRRDHIAEFVEKIMARNIATVGPYVGGMKQTQLNDTKTKQILVATYNMAAEGFDCQALDTLIMATPKREIEQCTGRIMRKKKNDRIHTPLIIDIADEFSNFKAWTQKRIKFYKDKNYKIQEYEVNTDSQPITVTLKRDWPWEPKNTEPESGSSSAEGSPTHHSEPSTHPLNAFSQPQSQQSTHDAVAVAVTGSDEIDLS
jgi:superfamily II DNA or RNA helicase